MMKQKLNKYQYAIQSLRKLYIEKQLIIII